MRPFLRITVNGDRLHVEGPELRADVSNRIGLVDGNHVFSIADFPEPDHDEALINPSAIYHPIFVTTAFEPDFALAAITHLSIEAGARSTMSLIKKPFDLDLLFPDYENLPGQVREQFEIGTQYNLPIGEFRINGLPVGYSRRQGRLAIWTYNLLDYACLLIMSAYVIPLALAIRHFARLYGEWVYGPAIISLMALVSLFVTLGLMISHLWWVRLMNHRVPAHLIRMLFYSNPKRIWLFKQRYYAAAERILTEPNKPD